MNLGLLQLVRVGHSVCICSQNGTQDLCCGEGVTWSLSTEERRLFVGMLSRDLSEEDVRHMFAAYGHVEDVSILRNAQGTSKGWWGHFC